MRKIFVFLLSVSLLTIFGCAEKVDIEADKEVLVKISNDEWIINAKAGNFEANVETYIDNAMRINAEEGILVGKEAIRESFRSFFEHYKVSEMEGNIEDIRVCGDLSVIRGTYQSIFVSKEGGEPTAGKGHWVGVYQRQPDGNWKCAYELSTEIKE